MPLNVADLLQPIPGDDPSGADLRYDPVYEKIKEARREDDEAPQGEWARARKTAEWPLAIRLISEAIQTKSKDLQLAAWLVEAELKQENLAGLRSGLELIQGLLEKFWDTMFPEIEDGDAELRAGPLSWVGMKLDIAVRSIPLVRAGHSLLKYNEAQLVVGYESSVQGDNKKVNARKAMIEEGKLAAEEWDTAFDETPKPFYKQLTADLTASLKLLESIDALGDKFGDAAPTYGPLKKALEDVQHVAVALLKKKLEVDPDPVEVEPVADAGAADGAAPADAGSGPLAAEPVSRDDAVNRVVGAAKYLRRTEPMNPAGYLMLRGLRWGEVRASQGDIEPRLLQAPTTQLRSQLKLMLLDGKWANLLESCETAMGQPCGRGWLDLQRYAIVACSKLGSGYSAVEFALRNALRAYLADVPELTGMMMMDDTPTANSETKEWLARELNGCAPAPLFEGEREGAVTNGDGDFEALDVARAGRTEEAVALLKQQLGRERTPRGRFRRRTQLAAVLVEAGQDAIAQPILDDLIMQIDNFKLEEWESGEMVAEPLALLYRAMHKLDADLGTRQNLYLRICRLDPIQALRCPV